MDVNNEAHFLAKVNKTPSFLIYNRKYDAFFDLNIDFTRPKQEELELSSDSEKDYQQDWIKAEEKRLT